MLLFFFSITIVAQNLKNIRNLYEAIKDEYDIGSENSFKTQLRNFTNRRKLYEALKDEYDLGSEKDFMKSVGFTIMDVNATSDNNIHDLYNAIKDDYETGSEDDFKDYLKNPINRKKFYEELKNEYVLGKYDYFIKCLGFSIVDVDINIPISYTKDNNTFAVIIGNEKYRNEAEVPYAISDATIFKEYVQNTLAVPEKQIKNIKDATYNDLRMAVNWLTQAMTVCRGKGKAIVYYAGHGIPNESDLSAYLLPVDGIGNDPGSAYSLKDMYEKLGSVEAQSITIFLDACFSGSKREEGMLASARGVALKAKASAPKGNMIVFTAAQGDETAYPYKDKQHGMFTYFLLKKLQDSKGEVTLGELSEYLTEEVGRQSFVKNNKMQTPTVNVSSPLENSWRQMKLK